MRDCPTVEGSSIPLIIHRIAVGDCLSRQSCNYHKCHRCIYRGKAANWQQPDTSGQMVDSTSHRGVPTRLVEVPRPEPLAIEVASKTGKKADAGKVPAGKNVPGKRKAKPIA